MNQKNAVCLKKAIHSATFVVIVMAALLGFSGCASLSKAQCLNGDWYEIGLSDGESGTESARFDEYVDTCAKYDVVPDFAKYSEGRTKGLEFFCTRSNGYSEGRQGRVYRKVCSGASEELFLEGHSLGYNVNSTEEIIEDLNSKIREEYKQIEIWETDLEKIRADQGSFGGGDRDEAIDAIFQFLNQSAEREADIAEAKSRIEEFQGSKTHAMIEYRRAIDEANQNGFEEEAIVEYLKVDDEGDVIGTNP